MKNPYFDLIGTVWRYGTPWRRAIIGYYIAFILAQAALGLIPYTVGRTIDVLQHFKPDRLSHVIFWLGIGIAAELMFWVFHGPARVVERRVALKLQQTYRLNLYEQLARLPLTWHQDHHSGNIITRLNRASTALRLFAESQFIYIQTIVKFLVSIGFLLWLSVPVGLLSIIASAAITYIILLFDRKLIPLYHAENEVDNHIGAGLFDYISNMTTILTLRLGDFTHKNLSHRMKAMWAFFRREVVLNEAKWFTMMILLSIVQAILLIGYIVHALHVTGTVMIGLVVMIVRYQWDLNTVFIDISMHYSELVRMDTDIKGMKPIVDDIKKFAHLPQGASKAKQWHTLQISELSFHHLRTSEQDHIINGINFTVKRGEKIALIGESGGGKSTLLNLLSGLYAPSNVQLTIDGTVFNSLEPLQAITTLIPQDPEIFENTIAFNITMDLSTTSQDMQNAAKLAGFLPVLNTLPSGFETDIREKGLNFSVGQKQRLALARGLFAARFSSLILMDEPTSSVDLPTEKEILSGVIHAFPDAAMIVSLHRLHLLPQFDSVIMLRHGKIVASGSTTELLRNPGPVRDLWAAYSQSQSDDFS
ncbi:MAG: msbA 1 [Gammaproteobacteria bacterium]|jgi:ABC-type multidrug transport system fused ATPase/permease subunit|nr:msbA 1 [Gammaproteobacteria bacterium]